MMSEFTKPVEDLGRNTADYVEARIDDLKLRTAKGLSLTLGKLLYMLLVLFIVSVILTALAVGGVMWIGELIGSYRRPPRQRDPVPDGESHPLRTLLLHPAERFRGSGDLPHQLKIQEEGEGIMERKPQYLNTKV